MTAAYALPQPLPPVKPLPTLILYSTGYAKFVELGWGGYGMLGDDVDYTTDGIVDLGALEQVTPPHISWR